MKPQPDYISRAVPRYVAERESILGALFCSKYPDLAVDQVAEALGGMERALEWFAAGADVAAERLGRRP